MTVQPVMGAERVVFYRERSSSYYAPGPYAVVRRRCLPRCARLCCAVPQCRSAPCCSCAAAAAAAECSSPPPPVCVSVCVQASGVVELPYLVAQATLMVCITYW
jgi:hypothetical protein